MDTKNQNIRTLPEEQVRQWFIEVLSDHGVESYRIKKEYTVTIANRRLRADIAIFERASTKVIAIVECKAPSVALSDDTLRQAVIYNSVVGARYIILTNGSKTVIYDSRTSVFTDKFPAGL